MLGRLEAGRPADLSDFPDASRWMVEDRPLWRDVHIDFNYWFFGSAALFRLEGPAGPRWAAWNRALVDALLKGQATAGHAAGSWPPVSRWSLEIGRVWTTATGALILETYYR